ncbi:type II toxin-antitoxin system RelE/ParE family toxin [Mesorhizobium sp. IMUNJ 23232]|uniref:type II toxin-antitoxin system RelE/ParE family toxin n=1 Tax=Mesorhizobium sp. IMUNJ 23232 TaxID=3376064 RepID=UPI0037A33105
MKARSPQAARRVRASIFASFQLLTAFPFAGRRQSTEGVRKLVTTQYAYLIYYAVDEADDTVVVLSVKHPAQEREYEDE